MAHCLLISCTNETRCIFCNSMAYASILSGVFLVASVVKLVRTVSVILMNRIAALEGVKVALEAALSDASEEESVVSQKVRLLPCVIKRVCF